MKIVGEIIEIEGKKFMITAAEHKHEFGQPRDRYGLQFPTAMWWRLEVRELVPVQMPVDWAAAIE